MTSLINRRRKKTARELAEMMGVSVRTVQNYMSEDRREYESRAAQRRRIAGTMHAQGASWEEIAEAIGGSEWAARGLVRRYKEECSASEKDPDTGDLFCHM